MEDVLAQYQNGYDGVLERLEIDLDSSQSRLRAEVVLRVVRIENGQEHWVRLRVVFSRIHSLRLDEDGLRGGGGVLYDGAYLGWSKETGAGVLDMDPGVAWVASGVRKLPELSMSRIVGICSVEAEALK